MVVLGLGQKVDVTEKGLMRQVFTSVRKRHSMADLLMEGKVVWIRLEHYSIN